MRLGYVIVYVEDVAATLSFYESAFGLERGFLDEEGMFGTLNTGSTSLSFAHESMIEKNGLDAWYNRLDETPPGVEIALVAQDVDAAYAKAIEYGAVATVVPAQKPWGQRVAYVRDNNGFLVEICSEMGG